MLENPKDAIKRPDGIEASGQLTPEILSRMAHLVAHGDMAWPQALSADQERHLLAEVRRLRRSRLIRFIASRIAADIANDLNE